MHERGEKWIIQQWFRTSILEASAHYHSDMVREVTALQDLGIRKAQEKAAASGENSEL